jgi:hypothetical protein
LQGKLTALEKPADEDAMHAYEHIFHIKEIGSTHAGSIESYIVPDIINSMPIVALCTTSSCFLTAQRDGAMSTLVRKFTLPSVRQESSAKLPYVVQQLGINCDSSRAAIIDERV